MGFALMLRHYKKMVDDFELKNDFSLSPRFIYADGVSGSAVIYKKRVDSAQSACRLVKTPKCPTSTERDEEYQLNAAFYRSKAAFDLLVAKNCEFEKRPPIEFGYSRAKPRNRSVGCKSVIEFREWQEAWRVRTEVETSSGRPPVNSGIRETRTLSARAATKIADSCEYMAIKKGGFKTFVTGTLNKEARDRLIICSIVSGDADFTEDGAEFTPIVFSYEVGEGMQKEITRTMDALQKMYQRGWTRKDGKNVDGHDGGLPYVWVVEVPENEHGTPNPHVHMLLGWAVKYRDFADWSERIESIWGNGAFHLEKIKDSTCAGAYMSKAAGYLCKAKGKKDQGLVKGNRYGISKSARAPVWKRISHSQYHAMGQLIYDVYDHLTVKYGEKYRERKRLNDALSKIPKDKKSLRLHIGKTLELVRSEIKKIPIRCNKYQIVIKGKAAAMSFFSWLKTDTAEGFKCQEWLPVKPIGLVWNNDEKLEVKDKLYFSELYRRFKISRGWRRLTPPIWMTELWSDNYFRHVRDLYYYDSNVIEDSKKECDNLSDYYLYNC